MIEVILWSILAGVVGMVIGGIIALFVLKKESPIAGVFVLLSAGIMVAIVCFELIPEAKELTDVWLTVASVGLGVLVVLLIDKCFEKEGEASYITAGISLLIAVAVHNLPEGMAKGASSITGSEILLALLVGLHNVPEGVALAAPLQKGGMKKWKILLLIAACGAVTVLGAVLGFTFGELSNVFATIAMGLAAGAMLYVVWEEVIPESKETYTGRFSTLIIVLGIAIGLVLTEYLG